MKLKIFQRFLEIFSSIEYYSKFICIGIFAGAKSSEIGKNERERRSFTFSSVQFMNLAHLFGDF